MGPSNNCTASTSATTCTFPLALAPGSYAGSLATYDAWNGAPTGNVLSQNQLFAFNVVKGKANTPSITLSGLTSYMRMLGLSDGTLAVSTAGGRFLVEVAAGTHGRMQIVAYDADGDAILGPGAPAFSVTAAGGFTSSVKAGVATIAAPSQAVKGHYSLTVSPSTCVTQPVSNCAYAANLAFLPIVAVNQSTDVVVQRTSSTAAPGNTLATIVGFHNVSSVQFDKNGNLFILDEASGASPTTVREFAPPYDGAAVATITEPNDSPPTVMAVAPNGSIGITDSSSASVGVYASNGSTVSSTPVTSPFSFGVATPVSLAFDSGNNLWCGSNSGGVIEQLTAASNYTSVGSFASGLSDPTSVVFDTSNNIYAGDVGTGSIHEFDAPGYTTSSFATITGLTGITQVARNEAPFWVGGTLEAYAGPFGTALIDYPPSKVASTLADTTVVGNFVAFDQDGNLYYSVNAAGRIGLMLGVDDYTTFHELTITNSSSVPTSVAVFPF